MPLDKLGIRESVEDEWEANFKSDLLAELTSRGFTSSEKTALDPYIDNLVGILTDTTDLGLDDYEEEVETRTNAEVNNAYGEKVEREQTETQKKIVRSHEVFNAKSGISFPEPVFSEPKFTSPVNIQDASYSIDEDYPNSYGAIDEAKNWYKINKSKQHVELVHSSGTSYKIDKDGNVTEEIKGNHKRIVHGDYSEEIKGNYDQIIKKSSYMHVGGEREEVFDKSVKRTIVKAFTDKVGGEVKLTYSKSYLIKISKDMTEKVSGDKLVESTNFELDTSKYTVNSTTFTVDGATVKLTSTGVMAVGGAPLQFSGG